MSTMAVFSGGGRSRLNPNAPLFIPAAYQQVEDFSPEWWELVKTTGWFRDHWFRQHQELETLDGDDEDDIVNLLPDSFDLSITDEFASFEAELDEAAHHQIMDAVQESGRTVPNKEKLKPGLESDAVAVMKSLGLNSPKNGVVRSVMEPAKYREKPLQCVSPKCSPRLVIHQPR